MSSQSIGKSWLELYDDIDELERQLADCQAYLHEAIKAFEALEEERAVDWRAMRGSNTFAGVGRGSGSRG